tara:strand:- start:131 stop:742 length:612 start_codon:yes stop_codon:yes gene_type:complete
MSSENLDFTSKIMAWCQDNLKYLIIGALIGLIIPLSWNYYKHLRMTENLVASDLYSELVNLIDLQEDYKNIESKISSEHENSIYEVLSKFMLSKQEFENNNYKVAKKHLEDIINIDIDVTYNSLAKIKISVINIQEKKYDDALLILNNIELKDSFKQVIFELKGDIYKYKGDIEKSLDFYNKAIEASAIDNENLLMKKNSVKN